MEHHSNFMMLHSHLYSFSLYEEKTGINGAKKLFYYLEIANLNYQQPQGVLYIGRYSTDAKNR